MKHTVSCSSTPKIIPMRDMKTGDIGVVVAAEGQKACAYRDHIVIRGYSSIVSLTNPEFTWSGGADHPVRLLSPGDTVTLTIKES